MNTDYYKPSKDLKNYAAGGPNDLGDELMKETQHEVPNMTPLDQEILSQSLSVLLACIRVRFDATQMTRFELVAQEDIDYLSVLERLAQYCEPNSHKFFIESTRILQEAMANGHNKVKHSNYGADENVMRQAIEEATREAQQLAKSIAYIDADL